MFTTREKLEYAMKGKVTNKTDNEFYKEMLMGSGGSTGEYLQIRDIQELIDNPDNCLFRGKTIQSMHDLGEYGMITYSTYTENNIKKAKITHYHNGTSEYHVYGGSTSSFPFGTGGVQIYHIGNEFVLKAGTKYYTSADDIQNFTLANDVVGWSKGFASNDYFIGIDSTGWNLIMGDDVHNLETVNKRDEWECNIGDIRLVNDLIFLKPYNQSANPFSFVSYDDLETLVKYNSTFIPTHFFNDYYIACDTAYSLAPIVRYTTEDFENPSEVKLADTTMLEHVNIEISDKYIYICYVLHHEYPDTAQDAYIVRSADGVNYERLNDKIYDFGKAPISASFYHINSEYKPTIFVVFSNTSLVDQVNIKEFTSLYQGERDVVDDLRRILLN